MQSRIFRNLEKRLISCEELFIDGLEIHLQVETCPYLSHKRLSVSIE